MEEEAIAVVAMVVPTEQEVGPVLKKMLREEDLENMTLRTIMNSLCKHFEVAFDDLAVHMKYVRAVIEEFLESEYKPGGIPKNVATETGEDETNLRPACVPSEQEIAPVLAKILSEEDLETLTVRLIMKHISQRFGVSLEDLAVRKKYVRAVIKEFLERECKPGHGRKNRDTRARKEMNARSGYIPTEQEIAPLLGKILDEEDLDKITASEIMKHISEHLDVASEDLEVRKGYVREEIDLFLNKGWKK